MATVHVEKGALGRISVYNAVDVAQEHRGWPLGSFVTSNDGLPLTEEFEVKLKQYTVGDSRDEWAVSEYGTTYHLVLVGAQRMIFALNGIDVAQTDKVVRAGEAVFFDNSVPHKWVTEEAGLQITIMSLRK